MCGFDDQREFLDYMVGQHVFIWDIPLVMKLCRTALNKQHPWLGDYELDPNGKPDAYPKFIRQMTNVSGSETIPVHRLKNGVYVPRNGLDTL